jgi:hypothetical protein
MQTPSAIFPLPWSHDVRLPNKVMAAQYNTTLPDETLIAAELEKTRKMLESRHASQQGAK